MTVASVNVNVSPLVAFLRTSATWGLDSSISTYSVPISEDTSSDNSQSHDFECSPDSFMVYSSRRVQDDSVNRWRRWFDGSSAKELWTEVHAKERRKSLNAFIGTGCVVNSKLKITWYLNTWSDGCRLTQPKMNFMTWRICVFNQRSDAIEIQSVWDDRIDLVGEHCMRDLSMLSFDYSLGQDNIQSWRASSHGAPQEDPHVLLPEVIVVWEVFSR